MNKYLPRRIEPVFASCLKEFPCVVVTGPRQSGKTTLARHVLQKSHSFVSLDEPDVRVIAKNDPRSFLETYTPPVVIDEIQYVPELLNYIKKQIDEKRSRKGQYILTGSQMFPLMANVSESLAGRAAVLTLLPLSWGERLKREVSSSPVDNQDLRCPDRPDRKMLGEGLLRGGFPELSIEPDRDVRRWYSSYVQTYLERDIRNLRNVGDMEEFQRFMRSLAARNGQLLNMAELGRDLGVALNTVKAWISVLVASHQIVLLRPYFRNIGKRLVKSPRVYFLDSGLVCYLTGIHDPEHLLNGPMGGALFESELVTELTKWACNRGEQPSLYSWRTSDGREVDCVMEYEGSLWPFEAKLAATYKSEFSRNVDCFMSLFKDAVLGRVVCSGGNLMNVRDKVAAVPFSWLSTW